jgi:hypothetical protein
MDFEIIEVSTEVLDDNNVGECSSLDDSDFDLVTVKVEMMVMDKEL